MKLNPALFVAVVLFGFTAEAETLYRWVDDQGRVSYGDQPPPAAAKTIEEKNLRSNVIENTKLSYAARLAVRDYPVTLYISDCGRLCNDARALLARRAIPHTVKTLQSPEDEEELKRVAGGAEVPVLLVGRSNVLRGYEASLWDAALDAAGYPKNPIETSLAPATPPAPANSAASPTPASPQGVESYTRP
ncbi:MAG: DUF4124 domain-containing protein [Burkholderiales bacterium]